MSIDFFSDSISEYVKDAITKAFNAGFQYAQSLSLNDEEFVYLGLPSGTKWAKQYLGVTNISNEGDYFSYVKSLEYRIPTEIQLNELKDCCKFVTKDDRILLIGPNGNELVF